MPPNLTGFPGPPFDSPGPSTTDGTFTGASGAVEVITSQLLTGNSVTLPSWTVPPGDLILVFVVSRERTITATVAGMGLTFTGALNGDKTADRLQDRLQVFQALVPATASGQITVTMTGNLKPVEVIAARYSGLDTTAPIEAAANFGTGGTDNSALTGSVTSLTDGALLVSIIGSRQRTASGITPSGYITDVLNQTSGPFNTGEEQLGTLIHKRLDAPGSVTTAATLSGVADWTLWTASLKRLGAPGAAAALAGQIDAVSALSSATLTTSITVAGQIDAVSDLPTATLSSSSVAAALVGTIPAVSGLSAAALTTSITIAGTIPAVSNLPGVTLTTSIKAAGTIPAVSALTGDLTTSITMAGTIAAVSGTTGTLSGPAALAGTIAAISNLPTATLTTSITPAGTVAAVSNLSTATLTTSIRMASSTAAVSALTGALTTSITMVGSTAAVSGDTGALTTSITMAGSTAAVSGLMGTLTFPVAQLTGTVAAVATAIGTLTTSIALAGTATAVASLAGDLTGGTAIVATLSPSEVTLGGAGPVEKRRAASGQGEEDWTLEMDDDIALLLILPS